MNPITRNCILIVVASAPPMDAEDVDSDADNLTSLHEVLLDEHAVASDHDDKQFASSNCNNTYMELMPTYENVTNDMFKQSNHRTSEKGINDLCKVSQDIFFLTNLLFKVHYVIYIVFDFR